MKSCIDESIWFLIPMYGILWGLSLLVVGAVVYALKEMFAS